MVRPALVIFDCDGVLVDSERIACRELASCLQRIGIPVATDEVIERYIGTSAASIFRDIEARFDRTLPPGFGDIVQAATLEAFGRELNPVAGMPAVVEALGASICVASSSTPARIRFSLERTGLLGHFDGRIFSATQVANGKPAPDLFLLAARELGVGPADCVVIEDSPAGVTAARAAGMDVIAFSGASHTSPELTARLRAAGATRFATRASEILQLLNS